MKKAVFLDRDGTIIKDKVYLNDPSGIEVLKESYEALQLLGKHGFLIVLVTNQSGVARGLVQEENINKINAIIIDDFGGREATIAGAYYCPHPVDGGCHCRKPNPGMLEKAAKDHKIDLHKSWMVGDRITDVEAGRRAGARSILIQNEFTEAMVHSFDQPEFTCSDVLEAAQIIVENSHSEG